jgi:hypothetical protein
VKAIFLPFCRFDGEGMPPRRGRQRENRTRAGSAFCASKNPLPLGGVFRHFLPPVPQTPICGAFSFFTVSVSGTAAVFSAPTFLSTLITHHFLDL